jgi:hypothetical protein
MTAGSPSPPVSAWYHDELAVTTFLGTPAYRAGGRDAQDGQSSKTDRPTEFGRQVNRSKRQTRAQARKQVAD